MILMEKAGGLAVTGGLVCQHFLQIVKGLRLPPPFQEPGISGQPALERGGGGLSCRMASVIHLS